MTRRFIGTVFWLALAADAGAAALQPLADIRSAVRDFAVREVGGPDRNVSIEVGRLDPRLRLAACADPLTTYFSPGARTLGHTTVGVRCDAPRAWSLFVPLHIDRLERVAVAPVALPRGHVIGAADVAFELRSVARLRQGYFKPNQGLIGKVTTRAVAAGTPYTHHLVAAEKLVRRGQRVVLSLRGGRVAVRVAGTALKDGARGDRIPVRNLSSRRIIEGIVHEPGLVLVGNGRARL